MAPAGKQKPEVQGPAPAPPLLECALSKDVDLVPVLPSTGAESNEDERTPIWPGAKEKRPASKAVHPFFLHSVYAGLVPPFSSSFTSILNHYGIQALHLRPNSVLLLSVFAFFCEAFVGVRPSVALFHHFFSLRLHDDAHSSACVSYVAAQSSNMLLKVGKKVENLRQGWVLMSLEDAKPQLEEPKGLPEKTSAWSSAKLSDPRVAPVLECFSRDIKTRRLTGGMIVKEYLAQRLEPLQVHSKPQWDYRAGDDELRLWSQDLPTEELSRVMAIFLGGDPSDPTEALGPLYHLDDRADVIAGLAVFNERGFLAAEGSGLVEVSCGDTSGKGEKEAKAAHNAGQEVLKEAEAAAKRCEEAEARLQALQGEQAKRRPWEEEARLDKQKKEVASRKTLLDAKGEALAAVENKKATELAGFPDVELGLRTLLHSLCEDRFDEPLAAPKSGFVALQNAIVHVDKILDNECHDARL
ncbi:hypothetical protein D1007_51823 [Hordeum vulgare]|nr:hypothetical protein D1007_51823 [Hordeum vulgare]